MNEYFNFKHFSVLQGNTGLKVNTDSVLLGAWAAVKDVKEVLDIGTGNGLLTLMIAQRSDAHITAIEISSEACMVALQNMMNSPWKERINIICTSFQDYYKNRDQKFDLIISNPPYFNNSLKSKSASRTLARHTESLPYNDIIDGVEKMLNPTGRFCLILPLAEKENFIKQALFKSLYCLECIEIKPKLNLPAKRVILKFGKQFGSFTNYTMAIEAIYPEGFSEEFKALTRDFYLQF